MNMYVSNLDPNVRDNDLRGLFTPFGEVASAKVITDRESGLSRRFGFVEMKDDAAAKKAMAELNAGSAPGRGINVTEAKPREDRSPRGGGYSNNRY